MSSPNSPNSPKPGNSEKSRPLSVLHINASDCKGGAGRSAYRIHTSLRSAGFRSRMLVHEKASGDPDVGLIAGARVRGPEQVAGKALNLAGLPYLCYPSSWLLARHPWFLEADVVQLYNLHGGYFSYTALPHLAAVRPLVWRLSDMWPVTGHCSFSHDCGRWETGCGKCPDLASYPPLRFDSTAVNFGLKRLAYSRSRIHVVSPSSWLEDIAMRSPLLGRFPVSRVPNGVDTDLFDPAGRRAARERLGIAPERTTLMFNAVDLKDERKGGRHLAELLRGLGPELELMLIIVGGGEMEGLEAPGREVLRLGYVSDPARLAEAYQAADVFVHPASADNLPNTILEAMAAGSAVVAFDAGGVADAVHEGRTGLLVRPGSARDMAAAVARLVRDPALRSALAGNARDLMLAEFNLSREADRFAELYGRLAR